MTPTKAERLFGAGRHDALFHGDTAMVPWPGHTRCSDPSELDGVKALLRRPPRLGEVDPRLLVATQPRVVGHHFHHYFEDRGAYRVLGRTSADPHSELNRFPVVEPDGRGRFVIRSGHHRSAAALLAGEMLVCRIVGHEPSDGPIALTPSVRLDPDDGTDVRAVLEALECDELWMETLCSRHERDLARHMSTVSNEHGAERR